MLTVGTDSDKDWKKNSIGEKVMAGHVVIDKLKELRYNCFR